MKTVKQIAKTINKNIKKWAQGRKKLIVVIDGYTGSGKTSIADQIARLNLDCSVVHLDDFVKHWKIRKQMMDTARNRSKVFEHKWYRYDAIERLVRAFRSKGGCIRLKVYDFSKNDFIAPQFFDLSKKILIIDGIFLLHPKHKRNMLWDKRVFLRVDYERAEARRISQDKKKWGKDYLPENHPDSYFRDFKVAYRRYVDLYRPEQKADLVIDIDNQINKKRREIP